MNKTVDNGFMVQRGKPGILLSPQMRHSIDFSVDVENYYKRTERICLQYLERSLVTKFCEVRDKVSPFHTLSSNGTSCAMSVAVNHISAVHIDKDFFLTYLTSRCAMIDGFDWNTSIAAPPAYHFIFPTIGYGVSISPGDVLIFNPLIPHCCSHKLLHYNDTSVFLSSFM